MSSIVKKAFEFITYDSTVPVRIEEGNLISYEPYTRASCIGYNNSVQITIHGPDGDITLNGPNICLKDYIREVEFSDLKLPKSYIKMIHEEGKHTQLEQDEANYNKRINTTAVLNYLHKVSASKDPMDKRICDWIASERKRLKNELERLDILTASDENIIQNALVVYANRERYNNDSEIANKIDDVRDRYLKMVDAYEYHEKESEA